MWSHAWTTKFRFIHRPSTYRVCAEAPLCAESRVDLDVEGSDSGQHGCPPAPNLSMKPQFRLGRRAERRRSRTVGWMVARFPDVTQGGGTTVISERLRIEQRSVGDVTRRSMHTRAARKPQHEVSAWPRPNPSLDRIDRPTNVLQLWLASAHSTASVAGNYRDGFASV